MPKEFEAAKKSYLSGDPRKLAEFVRTSALTPEQVEFVAMALLGEVKIKDGRGEKDWTRNLYLDYRASLGRHRLKELFMDDMSHTSREKIYDELAARHGYSSSDTVKKSITRAEKRRINAGEKPDDLFKLIEDGMPVEIEIQSRVLKTWIEKYPDLVERWWGKNTDMRKWIDKIPDEPSSLVLNFVPAKKDNE